MTAATGRELHEDARTTLARWQAPDADQRRLREVYLAHLAAHPDAAWRSCRPDHLTASAVVVDPEGRVLLVEHRKAGLWLQTGGHCEPTDTGLAQAALREATEESGIPGLRVDPEPLRLSRHAVPFCGPVQPAHHLDVQFLALAPSGSTFVRAPGEDHAAWFPADRLPAETDDDLRRLVSAATTRLRGTPSP